MDPGDSFLMFIVPEMNAEKMRISPAFRSRMRALEDSVVILRDRYTNMWRVGVSRLGRDLYFDDGWTIFYEENELELGDSLMFEYKGNNMFDFKVFGDSAVEKKCVGCSCVNVKEEDIVDEEEEEEEEELEEEERDEEEYLFSKVKEEVMDDEEKEENEDEDEEEVEVEDESKGKEEDEDEEEVEDEDEDEDEEEEEDEDEDKEYEEEEMSDEDTKPKRKLSMGRKSGVARKKREGYLNNAPHCYCAEIFESGLVPRPENPYFVSRSRKENRKNELLIPKNVIEDYCLQLPEETYLVDKKGNQWKTKIMRWGDGRVRLSKGWRGLCHMNNIKWEDVCICEFVRRENDGGWEILVYAVNSLDK